MEFLTYQAELAQDLRCRFWVLMTQYRIFNERGGGVP
jgi:hypothetical protein